MKKFVVVAFIAFWCALAGGSAAEEGAYKEYQMPEKFTLQIPKTWSQIPKKDLEGATGRKDRKQKGKKAVTGYEFIYGFQPGAKKYPSVYVQVYRKGKFTRAQIQAMAGTKGAKSDPKKEVAQVINSPSQDRKAYDASENMLWNSISYQTSDGEIARLTVTKFTSEGFVRLTFNSLMKEYKTNAKTFETIARAMKVDESIEYPSS